MLLKPPKSSISNVGIDGKNIRVVDGVADFTGVDPVKTSILVRQGWKPVSGPAPAPSPEEVRQANAQDEKTKSALALLQKVDGMSEDQLRQELNDRKIAHDPAADRETLIRVVHEVLVAEQRDEATKQPPGQAEGGESGGKPTTLKDITAAGEDDGSQSPPPPPPPPASKKKKSGGATFEQ